MFSKSAEFYDALYSWKDYAGEAAKIRAIVSSAAPEASTLLDVACGTGAHLERLRDWYAVEGVDMEPALLAVAKSRLPGVPLHLGDMRTSTSAGSSTWSRAFSARSATCSRRRTSCRRSPRWRVTWRRAA